MATVPGSHPTRLPLGRTNRRLPYERRLLLWLSLFCLALVGLAFALALVSSRSFTVTLLVVGPFALLGLLASSLLFDQLTRPLQTLANVVAALREDDFSFRARGARRGDSLGDLALEINALAANLQLQRTAANDALSLAEQVMQSMQSPVLAFGPESTLRLLNPAAEKAFSLLRAASLGRSAAELQLAALLATADQQLYPNLTLAPTASPAQPFGADPRTAPRWSVRRSAFRLHGVPHTLLVLTDVALALQQEERLAWQRLIRVLSHEINNSLTPIKSIAGSLRSSSPALPDLHRGLLVIEDRAASLHRFLAGYQQLTHLPPPTLRPVPLPALLERVAHLETRLPVTLCPGPELTLLADPDQLEQLLINLLGNAVEAALSTSAPPVVQLGWSASSTELLISIRDSGPGIANPANLFVPFYTTKPDGSGIGLVLAQQIAIGHGGSVSLHPVADPVGCRAELRLPLHRANRPGGELSEDA